MVKKVSKRSLMEEELMKLAEDGGEETAPFLKYYFEMMMQQEGRIKHKGEWLTEEEIFYREVEDLDDEDDSDR